MKSIQKKQLAHEEGGVCVWGGYPERLMRVRW